MFLKRALVVVAALALLVRVTIRDRIPVVAMVFYATPWPVLAALFLVAALAHRRERVALPLAACAISSLLFTGTLFRSHDSDEPAKSTLVLWNAHNDGFGDASIASLPAADVVALIETGRVPKSGFEKWRERWPFVSTSSKGILVASRSEIVERASPDLGAWARCRRFATGGLDLLIVDVKSNPPLPRNTALGRLAAWARENPAAVIAGDFNTPADSALFESLRATHDNAFEVAGSGWAPTWPLPFPVLHIDHVWTPRSRTPIRVRHVAAPSDHRRVEVDLL